MVLSFLKSAFKEINIRDKDVLIDETSSLNVTLVTFLFSNFY